MALHPIDWLIVGAYVVFALVVGVVFARRAGKDVDQYFLSGRSLPWWIAGTSMVATSFASDTPLVVSGWVRDHGIWKNWLWWCYCASGMLGVFVFARLWRRGEVMTKAEVAELRYGGPRAALLRGILGVMHAAITNTIILCWVLLAARKIMEVLLDISPDLALVLACVIALSYSLLAGFWGVVVTDLVQFVMAMVGAVALAWLSWDAVGGTEGVLAAAAAGGEFGENTLRLLPAPGEGGLFDASFWSVPVAALAVYLGVSWWAVENVDGATATVQRICAAKNEREGTLSVLWFNVGHYALRPWPWILVALASLVVLPDFRVESPVAGTVVEVEEARGEERIHIQLADGAVEEVSYALPEPEEGWLVDPKVAKGAEVTEGQLLAATDSERAYVVMMRRYLPVGLLGLVVASLLAAFMSTIDTHVNLAASFFVNDLYRRFWVPDAEAKHYVQAARVASVTVLILAGLVASQADSISQLFLFFLAFLSGVGPVYVLRWLWWRVKASTEITAMLTSAVATIYLTFEDHLGPLNVYWNLGPFSAGGALVPEGRLLLVVATSLAASLVAIFVSSRPKPEELLPFYRRVRPSGWWGPVARLAPEVAPRRGKAMILLGFFSGLALIYGSMLGLGLVLLGRGAEGSLALVIALFGAVGVAKAVRSQGREAQRAAAAADSAS